MSRKLPSFMVLAAIFAFATTTFLSMPMRKWEPALVAIISIPFILWANKRTTLIEWSNSQNISIVIVLLVIAIVKHRVFPAPTPYYSLMSLSLMFNLGEIAIVLSIIELHQKRLNETKIFLVMYSFFVMLAASHTAVTKFFVPFCGIYGISLIFFNRDLPHCKSPGTQKYAIRAIFLLIILGCCYTTSWLLVRNRYSLHTWYPFKNQTGSRGGSGFSPYTILGSGNISVSRVPVFRYFAQKGIYRLRGKAFDRYTNGIWRVHKNKLQPLKSTEKSGDKYHFMLNDKKPDTRSELLSLTPVNIVFAPLNCSKISLPVDTIYSNTEHIYTIHQTMHLQSTYTLTRSRLMKKLSLSEQKRYTQLPKNGKFFRQFANKIVGNTKDPAAQVRALQIYLEKNYPYTLKSKIEKEKDPIQDFLEKEQGAHCEMFASSLVMLARSQGIAARYVAGYYVHEWNNIGKFMTIRSCDAHAWTEIYFPGKGWITVDPTPSGDLNDMLSGYRSYAEDYREVFSEWLRRYQDLIFKFAFIIVITILVIFFLLRLKRKRLNLTTDKKQKISPQQQRIHLLLTSFITATSGHFREKLASETVREYCNSANKHMPEIWISFAKDLVIAFEMAIYKECELENEQLIKLESQWKQIVETDNEVK